MIIQGWQWISATLLIACLACFRWAMGRFFVRPAGLTTGMKVVRSFGIVFGLLHLAAIVDTPLVPDLRGASGAGLYLCALGLFWWALTASWRKPLSAAFSPDLPAHLVAHGPYKMIRHPLYCSYLLCWLAGWVTTGRLWLAPTFAVMFVIYVLAAAEEEKKFARSPFAQAYRRYCACTGLFLPNPLKLYLGSRKKFWQAAA